MSRDARQPSDVPVPRFPYSPAVVAGDLVFTAGQVAVDVAGTVVPGGVAEQTDQVLRNVAACLEAAGCTMDDVVKTTVFLADMKDFQEMNQVYARFFPDSPPARTTIAAAGLPRGARVEIDAVAVGRDH